MFYVSLNDNEHLILADATSVEVNDDNGYVKFFDRYGNIISLYRLDRIKGFHEAKEMKKCTN